MKNIHLVVLPLLFLFTSCSEDAEAPTNNPTLIFNRADVKVNELSRDQMFNALMSYEIGYYDTVFEKPKNLRAFKLRDVLELGYATNLDTIENSTFTFLALDGFQDSATSVQANEPGGYIAFEDLDVEGSDNWEPVATENNNDPAPFYVVWINEDQTPEDGYPWPYQLYAIDKN